MKIPAEAIGAIAAASASVVSRRLLAGEDVSSVAAAVTAGISTSTRSTTNKKKPVIPRHLQEQLLAEPDDSVEQHRHRHLVSGGGDSVDHKCDTSFIKCVINEECRSCFNGMEENDVDWTNVVPDTPCQDVLGFLHSAGHCTGLRGVGNEDVETFCGAFDSCVMWEDDGEEEAWDEGHPNDNIEYMDCSKLTECKWEGMHQQFLGDGICHDTMPGCYNSAICNYDGGDCCKDTCNYPGSDAYGECGMEGYACRDPKSANCQPVLARMYNEVCETEINKDIEFDDDAYERPDQKEKLPDCGVGEMLYRLIQYDSWGDGWDETQMTLRDHANESKDIYKGGLDYGSQGTVHLCLTKNEPKCYHVAVLNGVWGNEISWELRPIAGGAPVIAAGGSPTDCTVPLGGLIPDCPNTCDKTRPDTDITDPNYESYKDMESCIEKSCVIQVGTCSKREACAGCMQETTPDYCFADADFNSLINCSMCSCTEKRPAYCDAKATGEANWSGSNAASHEGTVKVKPAPDSSKGAACTPDQTLKGTSALDKFDKCADMGKMVTMLTEFDNENFGKLDVFEACAKTFATDQMHGGKQAMDCMRILHDIAGDDVGKDNGGGSLPENVAIAVAEMGYQLYYNGQGFCDCIVEVNGIAPMCNSFTGFKTLLYEAIDACKSLDMIDCAALDEFYSTCKQNLSREFSDPGFDNSDSSEQCEFVSGGCGESGAFPSLRKMDCGVGKEVAKSVWDFYKIFNRDCWDEIIRDNPGAGGDSDVAPSFPTTPVAPKPSPPVPSPRVQPTPKQPYSPWQPSAHEEKKKYYSPADQDPESEPDTEKAYTETKSHHYILYPVVILGLLAGGYVWYKKRKENFNYMRFRQMRAARNFGGDGDYHGVSMADSTSFEPATLPPRPDGLA